MDAAYQSACSLLISPVPGRYTAERTTVLIDNEYFVNYGCSYVLRTTVVGL